MATSHHYGKQAEGTYSSPTDFYLRRSRQIRERKALFFFLLLLLLGGGPFFKFPCTVFWGVKRQNFCLKRDVKRQKLCLKRGVKKQNLCLKRGVKRQKLFLKRGVKRQKLCLKGGGKRQKLRQKYYFPRRRSVKVSLSCFYNFQLSFIAGCFQFPDRDMETYRPFLRSRLPGLCAFDRRLGELGSFSLP